MVTWVKVTLSLLMSATPTSHSLTHYLLAQPPLLTDSLTLTSTVVLSLLMSAHVNTLASEHSLFSLPPLTLQLNCLSSKMFLAAISLWTKDLPARHTKPSTTCLQNWSRRLGRLGSDLRESLKRNRRRTSTKVLLVCSCTYDHQSKHRTSTPRTPTRQVGPASLLLVRL